MRAHLLVSLAALLSAGALASAEAQVLPLNDPAPATVAAPAALAPVKSEIELRRIPATGESGFLQGESAARVWSVYVKDAEVNRVNSLQIGFSASVSDAPNVSKLHVFVNDRPVGDIDLRGGERNLSRRLKLEPGTLTAGFNAVRVNFESAHRVDCSPQATYELWARIDPTTSGFLLNPPAATAQRDNGRDLTDLMTARVAADGSTPIYVRSPLNPDPREAARLVRVVDAMARGLNLTHPVVAFGAPPTGEAGLQVAIGARDALAADKLDLAGRSRISVNESDSRPLVLLTGEDSQALDQEAQSLVSEIDRLPALGSNEGVAAAKQTTGVAIDGDTTVRLGDLGLDGSGGRGRRWERSVTISLPQTFVPSVYAQVELRLKGSIPAGLLPGSSLNVSINGVGADSVPIAGDTAYDLDGQTLYLPFSAFHPGVNKLAFETVSVAPEDAACETAAQASRDMLRLSPESTLTFPHFARLQAGPEISRSLTSRGGVERVNAALIHPDRESLAAAMTLFANLSVEGRKLDVDVTYGAPANLNQSGVAFGPIADMPGELTRSLSNLYVEGGATYGYERANAAPGSEPPLTAAEGAGSASMGRSLWVKIVRDLRWMGFAFDDPSQRHKLILRPDDVLIAEAPVGGGSLARAGLALPSIGAAPASWLIVASQTSETLNRGVGSLIGGGDWEQFHGQAAVYDPGAHRVASLDRARLYYALPSDWTFADLRDALAVVFSDHAAAYIGVLVLLTTLLSALTAGLVTQRREDN